LIPQGNSQADIEENAYGDTSGRKTDRTETLEGKNLKGLARKTILPMRPMGWEQTIEPVKSISKTARITAMDSGLQGIPYDV
jgi:hypothetical protein